MPEKSGEEEYIPNSEYSELLDALFSNDEGLYVMLQSFHDESEQHAEDFPAASISAVVATGKVWQQFSLAWMAVLEHPDFDVRDKKGRRVFHTVEFESPEGRKGTVYENWSDSKLKAFNNALLETIAFHQLHVYAATVLVDEYEAVASKRLPVLADDNETIVNAKRSSLLGDKFAFCAYWAMGFAAGEARRYYPKQTEVAYYFEAGSTYDHHVYSLYDVAIAKSAGFFRFFSKPNFSPKDFAVPLQAADKMAYEASKEVSHQRHPNPPIKYMEMVNSKARWKQRYALIHLVTHGIDVWIQHWRKGDIEAFFSRLEREPFHLSGQKDASIPNS